MKILLSNLAKRKIKRLLRKDFKLEELLNKKMATLLSDPKHFDLRLHKLSGTTKWSVSIKPDMRMIFEYWQENIVVLDIGSHDEVY
jgi:addiction module RelE/StbE family toxin